MIRSPSGGLCEATHIDTAVARDGRRDVTSIVRLQVEKVSVEKRAIIWKKIGDVKGKKPADQFKHQLSDGGHPREPKGILERARPGRVAIGFINDKVFLLSPGVPTRRHAAARRVGFNEPRGRG